MPEVVRRCRPLLGTFVEVEAPESAIEPVFAAIARVHALMSFHEETSDLARLRRAPAGTYIALAPETVAVLRLARDLHIATDGLFDIAIARRLMAAGFLPRPPGIDLRRFIGTAADIEIEDDTHVRCRRPALVDLGGIAKGWAVDRAIDALLATGASGGLVNAGGDLRAVGHAAHAVHVRSSNGRVVASVEVQDAAIATSDNLRDRRHHGTQLATPHVGRDGRYVVADACITVVAETCAMADAFTKIALAEPDLAERLAPRFGVAQIERFAMSRAA